jgi:hypothetical protein
MSELSVGQLRGLTINDNIVTVPTGHTLKAPGSVIQVVRGTTNIEVTSSLNSYVDTGLTATITPKLASSLILVLVEQNGGVKSSGNTSNSLFIRLVYPNGSSDEFCKFLGFQGASGMLYNATASYTGAYFPNAVTPQTFKTQFSSVVAGQNVIIQANNPISSITLMEIAQ